MNQTLCGFNGCTSMAQKNIKLTIKHKDKTVDAIIQSCDNHKEEFIDYVKSFGPRVVKIDGQDIKYAKVN